MRMEQPPKPHYSASLPDLASPDFRAQLRSTITLPYPPSVNTLFAHVPSVHGGFIRVKTAKYKDWAKEAGLLLNSQRNTGQLVSHKGRVSITIKATPPKDNRRRDIDNICKAVLDLLVSSNIIIDDFLIDVLHLAWDREAQDVGVLVTVEDYYG